MEGTPSPSGRHPTDATDEKDPATEQQPEAGIDKRSTQRVSDLVNVDVSQPVLDRLVYTRDLKVTDRRTVSPQVRGIDPKLCSRLVLPLLDHWCED
jgi:hypothetical protein